MIKAGVPQELVNWLNRVGYKDGDVRACAWIKGARGWGQNDVKGGKNNIGDKQRRLEWLLDLTKRGGKDGGVSFVNEKPAASKDDDAVSLMAACCFA